VFLRIEILDGKYLIFMIVITNHTFIMLLILLVWCRCIVLQKFIIICVMFY